MCRAVCFGRNLGEFHPLSAAQVRSIWNLKRNLGTRPREGGDPLQRRGRPGRVAAGARARPAPHLRHPDGGGECRCARFRSGLGRRDFRTTLIYADCQLWPPRRRRWSPVLSAGGASLTKRLAQDAQIPSPQTTVAELGLASGVPYRVGACSSSRGEANRSGPGRTFTLAGTREEASAWRARSLLLHVPSERLQQHLQSSRS